MNRKFKWIAAFKIWLVIYPSITIFLFLFAKQLAPLPLYQRTLILTIALVPWMIFVGVPLVDYTIDRFTHKKTTNDK